MEFTGMLQSANPLLIDLKKHMRKKKKNTWESKMQNEFMILMHTKST